MGCSSSMQCVLLAIDVSLEITDWTIWRNFLNWSHPTLPFLHCPPAFITIKLCSVTPSTQGSTGQRVYLPLSFLPGCGLGDFTVSRLPRSVLRGFQYLMAPEGNKTGEKIIKINVSSSLSIIEKNKWLLEKKHST